MEEIVAALQQDTEAFRAQIQRLCSDHEGEWRTDALGFLLAQVRERQGLIEELDSRAFAELKHLLEVTRRVSTLHPWDRRARMIADIAGEGLMRSNASFERAQKRGSIDTAKRDFLDQITMDIIVFVRLLGYGSD